MSIEIMDRTIFHYYITLGDKFSLFGPSDKLSFVFTSNPHNLSPGLPPKWQSQSY